MPLPLSQDISSALRALRAGGVIVFPTETAYGIGCDPRHKKAVQRIFRLKGRVSNKPLLLVASSLAQVRRVAHLSGTALQLAKTYWPGALTLILPLRKPTALVLGVATKRDVAIRVSSSPLVQTLTRRFGFPLVATSANASGAMEARTLKEAQSYFCDRVDAYVDGGRLRKGLLSTLARVSDTGEIEILRFGAIHLCPPKK